MKRRLATIALIALVVDTSLWTVSAALTSTHTFVPILWAARPAVPPAPGRVSAPNDIHCTLQTGSSSVVDPRTNAWVHSCEGKNGHGMIVWTGETLLIDQLAAGSGSLSIEDGAVYVTAVREDGDLDVVLVPVPIVTMIK